MTLTSETFWDDRAQSYTARPITNVPAYEAGLDAITAHLRPEHHVVELGAGSGATAARLSRHVTHMLATDSAAQMVRIARTNATANMDVAQHTAKTLAHEGLRTDVVLALNLLHLLPDLDGDLGHIAEILPRGGLFISKTPYAGGGLNLWAPLLWVMRKIGQAPFVKFHRLDALKSAITRAGFEVVETTIQSGAPSRAIIVARKI
jgi:predicted TPR repeat methyltransferase